jgi:hypothetical protein
MGFFSNLSTVFNATTQVIVKGANVAVKTMDMVETTVDAGQLSADWIKSQAQALLLTEVKSRAAEYGWACETAQELEDCRILLLAMGDARVTAATRVKTVASAPVQLIPTSAPTPAPTAAPSFNAGNGTNPLDFL